MNPVSNDTENANLGVLAQAAIPTGLIVAMILVFTITSAAETRRIPSMTWSTVGYEDAGPLDFVQVEWGRRAR